MKRVDPKISRLSESLIDEIVGAVGLPKTRFTHGLFGRLLCGITDRLAALGVPFDHIIAGEGHTRLFIFVKYPNRKYLHNNPIIR
jgi:hypothetical protein